MKVRQKYGDMRWEALPEGEGNWQSIPTATRSPAGYRIYELQGLGECRRREKISINRNQTKVINNFNLETYFLLNFISLLYLILCIISCGKANLRGIYIKSVQMWNRGNIEEHFRWNLNKWRNKRKYKGQLTSILTW